MINYNYILIFLILGMRVSAQVPHISILVLNSDESLFDITIIQERIDSTFEYVRHSNKGSEGFYSLDTIPNNYIIDSLNNRYRLKDKKQLLHIHFQQDILVITRKNQSIYFLKSDSPNYEKHVSFYGMLILDKIPRKRGTYIISIGGDSNSPLFCPYPDNESEIPNWQDCILKKDSLLRDRIIENKFYKSHFSLEITKKDILKNRISKKIVTPQSIVNYLNQNKTAEKSYREIIQAIEVLSN